MHVFIYLALMSGLVAAIIYAASDTHARIPVACFTVATVVFLIAGTAHATTTKTETAGCYWGAAGVAVSWAGVGATAVTAEAHAGLLTGLAASQAAAATGGWASACPRLAGSLFGIRPPWRLTHNGCLRLGIPYHGYRMPFTSCWHGVRSIGQWRALMRPRVAGIIAAQYVRQQGGHRLP